MGKSHKLPFSTSQGVYTTPLQPVQVDIWGPAPVMLNGPRYFISFVDEYLTFKLLYCLAKKSDVASILKSFQLFAEKN